MAITVRALLKSIAGVCAMILGGAGSSVALEHPPTAPAANSAPSGGSSRVGLIAGAIGLALLIVGLIGVIIGRKRRTQ